MVKKQAEELAPELIEFRRQLHRFPELGCKEVETTKQIIDQLKRYEIEILDYQLETGAIAIVRGEKPGRTIAVRADIDALPLQELSGVDFASENSGTMHACGHDFHPTIILGAAKILNEAKNQLQGNVIFVFQPAEETLQGAKLIAKTSVFADQKVESILGIHCTPGFDTGVVGIKRGQFMASSSTLKITVKGESGHGANPHLCVDPVLIAGQIIVSLQSLVSRETSPLDTLVISICKISGGTAVNIIPEQVVLEGTVRTLSDTVLDGVEEMITRMAGIVAQAYRGSAEVELIKGTKPLMCDDEVVDDLEQSLFKSIGKQNIQYIQDATTGSEDFSEYSNHTKVAYCRIGARGEDERSHVPLHNAHIALDENVIEKGVNIVATYCLQAQNNRR